MYEIGNFEVGDHVIIIQEAIVNEVIDENGKTGYVYYIPFDGKKAIVLKNTVDFIMSSS
jgi:hypothetical protein